jgi:hypothetical protein
MTKRAPLQIVLDTMKEVSARSADCKDRGDDVRMYQLNVTWHWLDLVRKEIEEADAEIAGKTNP